ncbi:unannotated protein [freshwater metagenome]|uniref:Unannotated protein n=1 Tax=freshwater metagenome TaxID=449393 RepID=A0A6J7GAS6_9ZZZZ
MTAKDAIAAKATRKGELRKTGTFRSLGRRGEVIDISGDGEADFFALFFTSLLITEPLAAALLATFLAAFFIGSTMR